MREIERAKLIKEANILLDKLEEILNFIVDGIDAKKLKDAA